ncbi:MAG: SpoVG family protein, partial [Clostridia bacterium]|nr:SpoVG family protein [Clostridia bacterium]
MPKKNTTTPKAPDKQAAPKKPKLPSIDVRIDSLVDYEGSKTKAFASANIGGAFAIHGLRVMDSEKGLFVSMPSRKDGENYREV